MSLGRLPTRGRGAVAAAVIVVCCGAVATTVAADEDPIATASGQSGVVDGAIVAVDQPPVPPDTEVVAVGLAPMPVQVAVGRPPVRPHPHAAVPPPHRAADLGVHELIEALADAFATVEAGLALVDDLF
jgi:hypothetical protein